MSPEAITPDLYIEKLPDDRRQSMNKLRQTILENIPQGFEETMSYGMIGYVVPKSIYPSGYHVNPELPLPFINIASQKNFIAFYHLGIYSDKELLEWFKNEYSKYVKTKLDIGKSCIRFKKPDQIPLSLIAELVRKISPEEWISTYEAHLKTRLKDKV